MFSEKNNHYFVEFIRAETLGDDQEVAEGFWFRELLQEGVLAQWSQNATEEEFQRKNALLFFLGVRKRRGKIEFDSVLFAA
ncbi:hypothetical protein D3C75_1328610 [compost metagenome]